MGMKTRKPRFTPPRWLNSLMGLMLRTPGLQRLVGRSTALITFTGRKTGVAYTTPVTYAVRDGTVVMTAHESRQWWHNLAVKPAVQLRLAGSVHSGPARVLRGPEALPYFLAFLADRRTVARASGVGFDENGRPDARQAEAALGDTVVVVVQLGGPAGKPGREDVSLSV